MEMRTLIMQCHSGEKPFDAFVAGTIKYWKKAAGVLINRWDHPPAIDEDDLVQEMLLAAWLSIKKVDPAIGDPKKYVVFGAAKAARRWFHRQRGAYGYARSAGKNRSSDGRYPDAVDWIEQVGQSAARELSPQDEAMVILDSMQLAQTEHDRAVLEAFWQAPSVELVANKLCWDDGHLRPSARATKKTRAAVKKTICELTERAANF